MTQDKKTIEDYLRRGHFDVQMPDGLTDDYDNAIADFYARSKNLGKCLDSNSSEAVIHQIGDSCVSVDFLIYGRDYELGSWEQKNIRAHGSLITKDDELIYKVERVEELPDDYNPFNK